MCRTGAGGRRHSPARIAYATRWSLRRSRLARHLIVGHGPELVSTRTHCDGPPPRSPQPALVSSLRRLSPCIPGDVPRAFPGRFPLISPHRAAPGSAPPVALSVLRPDQHQHQPSRNLLRFITECPLVLPPRRLRDGPRSDETEQLHSVAQGFSLVELGRNVEFDFQFSQNPLAASGRWFLGVAAASAFDRSDRRACPLRQLQGRRRRRNPRRRRRSTTSHHVIKQHMQDRASRPSSSITCRLGHRRRRSSSWAARWDAGRADVRKTSIATTRRWRRRAHARETGRSAPPRKAATSSRSRLPTRRRSSRSIRIATCWAS